MKENNALKQHKKAEQEGEEHFSLNRPLSLPLPRSFVRPPDHRTISMKSLAKPSFTTKDKDDNHSNDVDPPPPPPPRPLPGNNRAGAFGEGDSGGGDGKAGPTHDEDEQQQEQEPQEGRYHGSGLEAKSESSPTGKDFHHSPPHDGTISSTGESSSEQPPLRPWPVIEEQPESDDETGEEAGASTEHTTRKATTAGVPPARAARDTSSWGDDQLNHLHERLRVISLRAKTPGTRAQPVRPPSLSRAQYTSDSNENNNPKETQEAECKFAECESGSCRQGPHVGSHVGPQCEAEFEPRSSSMSHESINIVPGTNSNLIQQSMSMDDGDANSMK